VKRWIFVHCVSIALSAIVYSQTGILGALPREIRILRNAMSSANEVSRAGHVFVTGKLQGKDVVIGASLYGKVNAAATAQLMITLFKVDRLVVTGVAGAIDSELSPGDIVVSTDVVQHDFGKWTESGFDVWEVPVTENDRLKFFKADTVLVRLIQKAAHGVHWIPLPIGSTPRLPRVTSGRLATGDQFIASQKKRAWIQEALHASAVDMEGAAVAQVCFQNRIPFVILRSISDFSDDAAEDDYTRWADVAAENSAKLVMAMLRLLN